MSVYGRLVAHAPRPLTPIGPGVVGGSFPGTTESLWSCRRSTLVVCAAMMVFLGGCGTNAADHAAGGVSSSGGTVTTYPPGSRRMAPTVAGTTLQGQRFSDSRYTGKVEVLNFWGSWCAPCRAEASQLENVYRQTKASGVRFVGVDVRDDRTQAAAFASRYGSTYPSLFDPDGQVAVKFRDPPVVTTPQTVVLDRTGRVVIVFRRALVTSDLEPALARLSAERD